MGKWRELTLEAVCSRITDGAHSSPPSVPEGKPMASVKDLTPFGIRLESCRRIPNEDFEKLVRQGCQPVKGDVLIAKDGATALDTVCEVKRNDDVVLLSSVAILRPNPAVIDSSYLRYYLDAASTRSYLKGSFISGAAIPRVVLKDLKRATVRVPPLPVQRRMAGILSAYDELIENNQRSIRILESMARSLYREWFVHFRFPGHEKVPLIVAPLGKIPQGWEITTLGVHLAELESGKRPKGGIRDVENGVPSIGAENINGIGLHDFAGEKFIPREFFREMRKGVVRDRDVAIYKDGAYIGKSSYFRDGFPHSECCVNEHVFLLRANGARLKQNALYLWLQESDTVQMIRSKNTNAAQPGINQQTIGGLELVLPNEKVAADFDRLVEPLLAKIINLARKIQNLRRTRDLLLPRLLSGQIDLAMETA